MLTFPNAKINIGLHVVEKRADGFHNIQTVFYPVGWCDALEIIQSDKHQFKRTGFRISGEAKNNLCLKAYELLKEKYNLPPVNIHLHKVIPIGAGLGGGSSDAASTLMVLNKIFDLNIAASELEELAKSIGADCAFFIRNTPVYATGKGDEFKEVSLSVNNNFILVIKPDVNVNTASAYKSIKPAQPQTQLKELTNQPIETWKESVVNDFEKPIAKKYPVIQLYLRSHVPPYYGAAGALKKKPLKC